MKPFNKKFVPRPKENVNEGIRAPKVRAIFPDGSNEILDKSIAIQKAKALGLDLILVSPNATPPVAKVMDYGKYSYEEKKRKHEAKRNQHITLTKELKFRPGTEEHDYEFKKKHALEFLRDKNKVKAVVQFRGREASHGDLGLKLLQRLISDVAEVGHPESTPRQEGRLATVLIAPK